MNPQRQHRYLVTRQVFLRSTCRTNNYENMNGLMTSFYRVFNVSIYLLRDKVHLKCIPDYLFSLYVPATPVPGMTNSQRFQKWTDILLYP